MSATDDPTERPAETGAAEGSPPEEGASRVRTTREGHVSFVQRLQRHFGRDVDPEINLQEDEDPSSTVEADESASGTSRGLIQKLAGQVPVGLRYQVRREIARGGMGTILRVWDEDLRRNLAMKVMHGRGRFDEESGFEGVDEEKLGRFLEEAQITGQLDHPGIVPVHDLGIDDRGQLYFTMRLVRGRELKEIFELARKGEEGWTRTRALGLVLKVCESMAFAHSKGVVHRDLKPSNIMVGRFGEVYVMDWGLARILGREDSHDLRLRPPEEASSLSLVRSVRKDESEANPDSPLVTMDGDVVGTPSYMAIEQAQGKLDQVGPRSDVYSLGSILYYMLSGRAPYVEPGERVSPHTVLNRVLQAPSEPVSHWVRDEPPELIAICEKAMAREAEQRYGSMLEVADDIQAYLENRVVHAYEGGSMAEFRKWVARNRGMAAGIAGMVTLSIVSALGFAWQKQRQFDEMGRQQAVTAQAKEDAEFQAERAQENQRLAEEREGQANRSAADASRSEAEARRSGYMANVLAADYSLKLNDVEEARERLRSSDPALRGWEWDYLRLRANPSLWNLGRVWSGGVDEVGLTPDGRTALTLARNGRLRLHDLETGDPTGIGVIPLTIVGATGIQTITPLRMDQTADGSRILLVGNDARIRVYDLRVGGAALLDLPPPGIPGHESRVSTAAFSRDGRLLVSGADNGSIILWDAVGDVVGRFRGHRGSVTDMAWSPDSTLFASSSTDGTLRIWDAVLGQVIHVLRGHQGAVRGVVWDAEGERAFSVGVDGTVNQWNAQSGRLIASWAGHDGPVLSIDYDPVYERLVTASEDRTARVWDAHGGEVIVLRGHEADVWDAAFSPDGQLVVTCARDGSVEVWDARGDLSVSELNLHREAVHALAFHPEQNLLVTGGEDEELVLWDALSGEPLRRMRGHTALIYQARFSPDGRWAYSASHDHSVRRWDVETGQVRTIYAHPMRVTAIGVTPDGSRVITGCADNLVRLFDAETTELLQERSGHRRAITDVAVSEDGRRFATSGLDVRVWNVDDDEAELVLKHPSMFLSLAFSPDGSRLAASSMKGEVVLWDTDTGDQIASLRDHESRTRAVAFSPDGRRFASGSDDGTVRIRDAESGQALLVIEWPGAGITELAFSPDGSRLAAASKEGPVRIWETGLVEERRAAWVEAQELRNLAEPMVESLFDDLFFLEQVLLAIQSDPDLDPKLRITAIRLANLRGDDPSTLWERTLVDALGAGNDPQIYDRALRRAEAARSLDVESHTRERDQDHRVLLALGVARERNGLHTEAVQALDLARQVDLELTASTRQVNFSRREETIRLLFLSMAHHHAGDDEQAAAALELAQREILADPEVAFDEVVRVVHAEVEELLRPDGES